MTRIRAFLMLLVLGLPGAACAAAAGSVVFLIGEATAVRGGTAVKLARGAEVEAGDRIRTGPASNLHVKLQDGSQLAMRPESELAIDQFGKAPGQNKDSAAMSLLRGGVRALTGGIASSNPDGFQVKTNTATIGIRGTGFNLVLCDGGNCGKGSKDGLYAGIFEGRISSTNQAGRADFGKNEFFHVADAKSMPQRLLEPPSFLGDRLEGQIRSRGERAAGGGLPSPNAAAPTPAKSVESQPVATAVKESPKEKAETVNFPSYIEPVRYDKPGVGVGPPPSAGSYTLYLRTAEYRASSADLNAQNAVDNLKVTYSGSDVVRLELNGNPSIYSRQSSLGYTAGGYETGQDGGVIAWGRWAGGTAAIGGWGTQTLEQNQGFHWIFGTRTDPATLPAGSASFNLIGATTPTETRTGALAGWSVVGGNVSANFTTGAISGNLGLQLLRSSGLGAFNMAYSGTLSGADAALSGLVTKTSGTATVCAGGCAMAGYLTLYGTAASNAGMTYTFNTGTYSVQGVAAFRR